MTEAVSFKALVKECAADEFIVEQFNGVYKRQVKAPLTPLLGDTIPPGTSENEKAVLAEFIVFVNDHIWQKALAAAQRMGMPIMPISKVPKDDRGFGRPKNSTRIFGRPKKSPH